ncbi:MAG: hypothetical protein WCI17_03005 [bacterium]
MKDEFAGLMKKRAGLEDQFKASLKLINDARGTTDTPSSFNTETMRKYRDTVLTLEKALDNHPRILALQELYDVAQTDRVAVSRQQANILDGWRAARDSHRKQLEDALHAADTAAEAERQQLLQKAGVKDPRMLSPEDLKLFHAAGQRFSAANAAAKDAYKLASDLQAEKKAREKDGSATRFEELNARDTELQQAQAQFKKQMLQLRTELRTSDAAIAQLQAAAVETSQAHLVAMESRPEVAAAQKFIDGCDSIRADIDRRARILRKAILAKDSGYKADLDKQAAAGGLAQVGEDFWNAEG